MFSVGDIVEIGIYSDNFETVFPKKPKIGIVFKIQPFIFYNIEHVGIFVLVGTDKEMVYPNEIRLAQSPIENKTLDQLMNPC